MLSSYLWIRGKGFLKILLFRELSLSKLMLKSN